jgi:predicted porin
LKLQSERFAGLQASAMYVQNGATSSQVTNSGANSGYTGGKNDQTGWGLGLNYTWKKLILTGAYQSLKATDPYTADAVQVANGGLTISTSLGQPAPFSTAGTGRNVTDNQAYVGATYDFGILKAYAGWIDRKVSSQINSNAYIKRTAQEIGVRSDLTKTIEGWASVGNGRYQVFGTGEPTANLIGYQLGANYILSKRSNLYAIYGQSGTSNTTNAAGSTTSYRASQYAVGVRHTF